MLLVGIFFHIFYLLFCKMSSKSKSLSGSKTINNKIKLNGYTYRTVLSSGTKSSYDVDGNEPDLFSCSFSVKDL